jgi:serine/threonine protein kinase
LTAKTALEIIHGDIKPENVLIFKDNTGEYTAKVTDFGYSTRFAHKDDLINMPKSRPWNAPEHDRDRFTPVQAQRMDVFSFGMLCVWVLFEKYLSGTVVLPQKAQWANQYFQDKTQQHLSKHVLDNLKHDNKLALLAQQLIYAEQDIDQDIKQALERLFSILLAYNPNERHISLEEMFGWLGIAQ